MAAAELPSFYGQKTRNGTVTQNQSNNLDEQSNATDMEPSSQSAQGDGPTRHAPRHPTMQERQTSFKSPFQNGGHPERGDSYNEDTRENSYEKFRRQKQRPAQMKRMYSVQSVIPIRLPWTQWMASEHKNHFVAFIGEFIGTTLFLFFAFAGTGVANAASIASSQTTTGSSTTAAFNPIVYLYIALSFGFSLMVNAWIFFRISGGLFNPAVTLALCLLKAIGPVRAMIVFIAQIFGACFASYLVQVIFPTPLNVNTTLGQDTTIAQGLFIEALCTAELVFTIVMLAMEKHKATFIAPVGIGLALFIGELVGVFYTGGSLNPARSFGPAAVTHTFTRQHWIYWVGPFMGSLFAVAFYWFIKALEYEMANPGQDSDVTHVKSKRNDPPMVDEGVAGLSPQVSRK